MRRPRHRGHHQSPETLTQGAGAARPHPPQSPHLTDNREPRTENRERVVPFNLSAFEAANPSQRRGWIPRTSLDSSKALTGYARRVILNGAEWAYRNIGLARRIVNGLANHIGYLTPQAATADRDWNTAIEDRFRQAALFPGIFDRAGKLHFYTWQLMLSRLRLKHGDVLTVLTETSTGIASVIVYEAPQIDDGQSSEKRPNLTDGVFTDKFGRHLSYRPVDTEDPTKWGSVDAADAIYFGDFESHGQVRGISALAHALIHLQDRAEIHGDWKHAIKVASQIGMYKKREKTVPFPGQHFAGDPESVPVGTDANGDTVRANVEKIYGSGYMDGNLAAGESYELLHDDRPHPNQRELLDDFVRDTSWGAGVAPEVLWQLSGQTGPSTRFLMADFQRWILQEQMRLEAACRKFWVYFVAKELNSKRMPFPKGDDQWWKCEWVPQADLTIDRGREGALELNQLRMGATTLSDIWRRSGGDFATAFDKQLADLTLARTKAQAAGFQLHEVMPGFFTPPAPDPPPDQNQRTE